MHPTLTGRLSHHHHHHNTLTHDDKVKLYLEENSFSRASQSLVPLAMYPSLTSYSAATVRCRNPPIPILQLLLLLSDAKEGSFTIAAAALAVVRSRCCAAEVAVYVVSVHLLLSTGLG
jgi:fatty acid desaturase